MDLAAQLRDLQVRAGGPSIRAIERLIARQGREHPMARSTIQEKIAGRSPVNLLQVLSIVEALAEHARLNGIPLPPQEIDPGVWRERVATVLAISRGAGAIAGFGEMSAGWEIDWNVEPLQQAHMFDLVKVINESKSVEVANWLPKVIGEMMQAEMSFVGFLESAAQDSPQGVVRTVAAFHAEFSSYEPDAWEGQRDPWYVSEKDRTIGPLLTHAARRHGASASPAIVAGLRRAGVGTYVDDFLASVGRWHLSKNIEAAVNHLRSAALGKDADRLLGLVGEKRTSDRLLEVFRHFERLGNGDDIKLLRGVGAAESYRIGEVFKAFKAAEVPEDVLVHIARGVPYGRHAEFAQRLQSSGHEGIAQLILRVKDEPPF
ncbi:hypothetical protein ACIQMR_18410 [Streptomyces sp. NPDC091376]|uniref:hypothetical protein n=1 Tax=Streptomyces sp. NPDC091376 TaxID=3365994 RepID=UPI0038189455